MFYDLTEHDLTIGACFAFGGHWRFLEVFTKEQIETFHAGRRVYQDHDGKPDLESVDQFENRLNQGRISTAILCLKSAKHGLKEAPRTLAKVQSAIKSAEGALRHAKTRYRHLV